jgi:hypothetical protein
MHIVDYKLSKKKEFINWNKIGNSKPNENPLYDIFFSGQKTSKFREEFTIF